MTLSGSTPVQLLLLDFGIVPVAGGLVYAAFVRVWGHLHGSGCCCREWLLRYRVRHCLPQALPQGRTFYVRHASCPM